MLLPYYYDYYSWAHVGVYDNSGKDVLIMSGLTLSFLNLHIISINVK